MKLTLRIFLVLTLLVMCIASFAIPNTTSVQALDPYPQPTWQATPILPDDPLPPDILEPAAWCDQLPAYNNVCAYGFDYSPGGLPRWYMTKDGPIDLQPAYNYCIVWTNAYGNHFDTCLTMHLHSYHGGAGVDGSGRNIYISEPWLICGGGYISFDVWMTNVYGEIIMAEIRQPNNYFLYCRFFPHSSRYL